MIEGEGGTTFCCVLARLWLRRETRMLDDLQCHNFHRGGRRSSLLQPQGPLLMSRRTSAEVKIEDVASLLCLSGRSPMRKKDYTSVF